MTAERLNKSLHLQVLNKPVPWSSWGILIWVIDSPHESVRKMRLFQQPRTLAIPVNERPCEKVGKLFVLVFHTRPAGLNESPSKKEGKYVPALRVHQKSHAPQ